MSYLQLPEVLAIAKVSESTLYRLINSGDFPYPVKRRMGHSSKAWKRSSLNRWLEENGGVVGEEYLESRRKNIRLLSGSTRRYEEIGGRKFGLWTVKAFAYVQRGAAHWVCRCRCGKMSVVSANKLKSGRSKSCGCKGRRTDRECPTHHPLYAVWSQMRQRCRNKTHPLYWRYGGKGIGICDVWAKDFWAFVDQMGPRPAGCVLRRIDRNGFYCPENCRWGGRGDKTLH